MKSRIVLILSFLMLSVMLAGCSAQNSQAPETVRESPQAETNTPSQPTKKNLKMGTSSVSIAMADSGVKALEDMGYEVEVVVFDDYFVPNIALVEGSLDANFYQHKSFMDQYNESNQTDIIMLEPKMYEFYSGLYSIYADSVENLPDGGIVGIAVDASNIDRDLKNLESVGIITLTEKPQSGSIYTILDIKENPHNYDFVSSDHTKYTNMDEYACLLGTSNTMAAADVNPTRNLLVKFPESANALGICIMPEYENEQWVKDIMSVYTSDEAVATVKPESGFVPSFK